MLLSTPLAAAGLLTAGGLALLYRFRKRADRRDMPSLLLWPKPARLVVSRKSHERFRFPPSFFLELAILLLLTFAALTPLVFLRTDTLLYVIRDVSPSMQATDEKGETAAARAERILAAERAARDAGAVIVRDVDSSERLAAELARTKSADVLVLTDHPPTGESGRGVRWRSVGAPRPNRAITAAVRTSTAVHLEVSTFGGRRGEDASSTGKVTRLSLPCPWSATNVVVSLADLNLSLPGDALVADDAVTLPPPFRPAPTVALAITNAALARVVRRAVDATGFATYVPPDKADVVIADHPVGDTEARPHVLRFAVPVEQASPPARVAAFEADPGDRLFDGVTFPENTVVIRGERTLTLGFASAAAPFFRTPSFPALMVNFLTEAARERERGSDVPVASHTPQGILSATESDLSGNLPGVWGEAAVAERLTAASWIAVWILAFLAVAGLILWGALFHRRAAYVLAALTAVALLRPHVTLDGPGGTLVALVDRSLSVGDAAQRDEDFALKAIASTRPSGARLEIVDFDDSDAAAALEQADARVADGERARYVMLSDGLFVDAVSHRALSSTPVDTMLFSRPLSNDLAIVRVAAPNDVAPGATVPVAVWVSSDTEVTASWRFLAGTNVLARGTRTFPRGKTPVHLRDRAPRLGTVRRYRFELDVPAGDPMPENNAAQFLVRTSARKSVCVVKARPESSLASFLSASGVPATGVAPDDFDTSLATLSGYAGVILEDQPAERFGSADFTRLADWVTRLGGGLAMTGGEHTFGPGGWHGSAVEEILPVSLERRMDKRKYALSLAIVMDRSGSMAMSAGRGGRTKMDMANLGAASAIDMLAAGDFVSVIAVDSTPHLILKMQAVEEARAHMDDVLGIASEGGGIFVEQGLLAGLRELEKTETPLKHLVLFADASDSEEPGNYRELLEKAAAAGITTSVIGLGSLRDCDAELLKQIAVAGKGDCYFENDAREIPRLFMQDTFLATKMLMVTNPTPLAVTAALREITDAVPPASNVAGGYNLLYARETASVAVVTADDEAAPFVAYQPAGTGRTAVFAGEIEGRFAAPLMQTPFGKELVVALGRYVAGAGAPPPQGYACDVRLVRGGALVTAVPEDAAALARSNDALAVRVIRDPGGTNEVRRLRWVAEDVLEAFVPIRGDETLVCVVEYPDGGTVVLPPVCLPYPAEFQPSEDPGEGKRALERLASRTGGRFVSSVAGLWEGVEGQRYRRDFAPLIYLLVAVLFLALVARRLLVLEVVGARKYAIIPRLKKGK